MQPPVIKVNICMFNVWRVGLGVICEAVVDDLGIKRAGEHDGRERYLASCTKKKRITT